ncbi:hypothetical protein GCM10027062_28770 [Nocardioides hungaricus]
MIDVRTALPPYLYLPCTVHEDGEGFDPMVRPVAAGPGLVAYTALDRLRRAQGADQSWVVVPLTLISGLRRRLGLAALLLDDGLPEEERAHG